MTTIFPDVNTLGKGLISGLRLRRHEGGGSGIDETPGKGIKKSPSSEGTQPLLEPAGTEPVSLSKLFQLYDCQKEKKWRLFFFKQETLHQKPKENSGATGIFFFPGENMPYR